MMNFEDTLSYIQRKIERLDVENRKIIIWGMGQVASLYDNAYRIEKINIYAYTAKNAEQGSYNGYPIISPDEISCIKNPLIIINVKNQVYVREIEDYITRLSERNSSVDYLLADEFFFGKNADTIRNNIQILADKKSQKVYEELIMRRTYNSMQMSDLFEDDQYWTLPPFRADDINEVFVDMGGYVGDTLEKYLFIKFGTFQKYYVFEPDEKNYSALTKRIARLNEEWNLDADKIIPIFAGVGKEDGLFCFKEVELNSAGSHYVSETVGGGEKSYKIGQLFQRY